MRPSRIGIVTAGIVAAGALAAPSSGLVAAHTAAKRAADPTTPIEHLVVIFQENVSFDHYFGTYPDALNPQGEPAFSARAGTPLVNGLSGALLSNNPNLANPHRLDRSEALTCDQGHDYTPEQSAADSGLEDRYVQNTSATNSGAGTPKTRGQCDNPPLSTATPGDDAVMDYYDGNTVTALWNYAQHFAMSDNSYGTTFGPSTPGALNLVSGTTYPALCAAGTGTTPNADGSDPDVYNGNGDVQACPGGISTSAPPGASPPTGTGTVVSDPDQYYDVCSNAAHTAALGGPNVGDALSAAGISWGWFNGGFQSPGYVSGRPGTSDPSTVCKSAHYNIGAGASLDGQACTKSTAPASLAPFCQSDYSAHHQPFQYYASTSNPQHLPPTSVAAIGHADQANHQYDLADLWAAADAGHLPAVSLLKAPRFQDGHPGNSDPLDEQRFVVDTINHLEQLPTWSSTAVVIAWDDSDGWYDHVMGPVDMQSQTPLDTLVGGKSCGGSQSQVPVGNDSKPEQARCGNGPRLPLLVISPWAKQNFVDHSVTNQSSVLRFIEDNWNLGRLGSGSADGLAGSLDGLFAFGRQGDEGGRRLVLDPSSGEPARSGG